MFRGMDAMNAASMLLQVTTLMSAVGWQLTLAHRNTERLLSLFVDSLHVTAAERAPKRHSQSSEYGGEIYFEIRFRAEQVIVYNTVTFFALVSPLCMHFAFISCVL